jgi:cellulose synthase/poly-beta-1,6-N-acetylglucosamine synthase-like glycosyltransferase
MISLLLSLPLLCYCGFVVRLIIATMRFPNNAARGAVFRPGISVIIPFKNEAANLKTLLASLSKEEYQGPWEILLVNDGSDDDFKKTTDPFLTSTQVPLRIIDSRPDSGARLTSKQQALDKGVSEARYEWCVFTDADMVFEKDWLSSLAENAAKNSDLVFGHTKIAEGGGLFSALQRFQLEFLFSAAYSFHAAGIDGSCMGNNLLVRKKAYADIGGQAGIGYSIVEDRALYRAFKCRGLKISPAFPFSSKASTFACATLPQFYHQMLRWSRGGFSPRSPLLPAALLLTIQNAALLSVLPGRLSQINASLSIVNFSLTLLFLFISFKKINSKENALYFPVYFLFLAFETVVFCLSFFFTYKVNWKKRKV